MRSLSTYPPPSPNMQVTRKHYRRSLERPNSEIIEANEDRAKAAAYGIVLLHQKQALQSQNNELTASFDATKRELETAMEVRGGVCG